MKRALKTPGLHLHGRRAKDGRTHGWAVDAASKTETEKSFWKFSDEIKEKGVSSGINSVLPDTNFGPM
jgi:hypothetical protein